MIQTRKKALLDKLAIEIQKTQETAEKKKKTADYFSRHSSRSQQGDRRYHEDAKLLTQEQLVRLSTLKKEIASGSGKKAKKVEAASFVTVKYQDKRETGFYFTNHAASLSGIQIITSNSPLGKAIEGKKEGESFCYQVERDGQKSSFCGKIIKVE